MAEITFEQFRDEWLLDVQTGSPSTIELGSRFARKIVTQWLDVEDSSDDLYFCDGSGDGGIDIAYLSRGESGVGSNEDTAQGDTWYLVQSKYGSAFAGVSTLLEEGQKVIDTLDGKRKKLSSLTQDLMEKLAIFRRQASEMDRIVLVFATEAAINEAQQRALADLRAMGQARLGPLFDVEAVSIATIYQNTQDAALAPKLVPLRAKLDESGDDLLVGSVSVLNLYEFLKAYRAQTGDLDQLFEKNIRRFLGARGKVNKAMQQTLKEEPERFGLYNNGLTIVVEDFEKNGAGVTKLLEPYVVNGCQTTRTIWEVCQQRLEAGGKRTDAEMESWKSRAAKGVVVTKVVKVGPSGEKLLEAITRYTNTQNAVREKDFLALQTDFRAWTQRMGERYGVFLEIQRGGWESRRALQRQKPGLQQFRESANAFDLMKVFGAGWLGEAGIAYSRNDAFLVNGPVFKRITEDKESDEPFGIDDLYAAYRLKKAADEFGFGRGTDTRPTRRQTRFVFYMTVIELLKDVLVRAQLPTTPRDLTKALLRLFEPGNNAEEARQRLLGAALDLVDEYLTPGAEDSIFNEPGFAASQNLVTFLKGERFGKSEESSPRYRALVAVSRKALGHGKPPPRDLIMQSIKGK